MTSKLINGHAIAETLRQSVKDSVTKFTLTHGLKPGLAIVMVGDNPASSSYVNIKIKRCAEIGIHSELLHYPVDVTEAKLIEAIDILNARKDIHGIIIQLPLPAHLNANDLIEHISPLKDVDGLHLQNIGALHSNRPGIIPCTPQGILALLKSLPISLEGKHAVIIGRSMIVGRPMAALLLAENCTVTQIHSRSENWSPLTQHADIIIIAAGTPKLLTAADIKSGAIVIDVGSTRIVHPDGTSIFIGDIDASVLEKAGYVTPVPGGVGPMTVAMLLQNTITSAWKNTE